MFILTIDVIGTTAFGGPFGAIESNDPSEHIGGMIEVFHQYKV